MDVTAERSKRYRSSSPSAASSSSGGSSPRRGGSPPPKFHRATPNSTNEYTCHLSPTCNQPGKSTTHDSQVDLERHQLQFHNYICRAPIRDWAAGGGPSTRSSTRNAAEGSGLPNGFVSGGGRKQMKECGKVFPDERFLELHHTEVHDAMARERQHNGEKIFECFIPSPSCGKKFSTPMTRRNHLKAKHHYPPEYFFAITNHGLNRIIEQDGLGASFIRPRREHPTSSRNTVGSNAPGTAPPSTSKSPPAPDQEQSPPQISEARMEVDEVDALAGKLDTTLALAFVPTQVRRKGKAKEVVMDTTS